MSTNTYIEDNIQEFGVEHHWPNCKIMTSIITARDTKVDIVEKPLWGLTCYMDNSVQSCLKDEYIYHESLVVPIMSSVKDPKRVCIIGGGEGATLREVLKWSSVEEVDMYDWDKEVVELFRTKYKKWSQGSFDDPRVVLIYENIFEIMNDKPKNKYDVVIIDLFEPTVENYKWWTKLLDNITNSWVSDNGSIVMYSGMRNVLFNKNKQPYQELIKYLTENINNTLKQNEDGSYESILIRNVIPYKVYIPSFVGESTFILLTKNDAKSINTTIKSHLTDEIWNSYKLFNW
jgi:spermidine synthase